MAFCSCLFCFDVGIFCLFCSWFLIVLLENFWRGCLFSLGFCLFRFVKGFLFVLFLAISKSFFSSSFILFLTFIVFGSFGFVCLFVCFGGGLLCLVLSFCFLGGWSLICFVYL